METKKEILYQLLQEIREEIDRNEREDGTYAFDVKRVQIGMSWCILQGTPTPRKAMTA